MKGLITICSECQTPTALRDLSRQVQAPRPKLDKFELTMCDTMAVGEMG